MIGSISHDPGQHLSQSRSVYNIHSNHPTSTSGAANHLMSTNLGIHSNHLTSSGAALRPNHLIKCPSSLAVHTSGIEYICNFTAPHKIVNRQSRSGDQVLLYINNVCCIKLLCCAAQDLRRISWYDDHQQSVAIAPG